MRILVALTLQIAWQNVAVRVGGTHFVQVSRCKTAFVVWTAYEEGVAFAGEEVLQRIPQVSVSQLPWISHAVEVWTVFATRSVPGCEAGLSRLIAPILQTPWEPMLVIADRKAIQMFLYVVWRHVECMPSSCQPGRKLKPKVLSSRGCSSCQAKYGRTTTKD